MQMLCYKCGHSWSYKGKKTEGEDYITCPGCYYKIRFEKALIGCPSEQKLLINLPNKKRLPSELPIKLPTTKLKIEFEAIRDQDGFVYLVDKKIAKQFKEALDDEEVEETSLPRSGVEEQGPVIRILPPKFEIIRVIPRDPIKILEHQRGFF
jgi:DNA-directed RNA polymerase subunit RPC12/RpoP